MVLANSSNKLTCIVCAVPASIVQTDAMRSTAYE